MNHGPKGYDEGCRCYVCALANRKRENRARLQRDGHSYPRHRNVRQWPLAELLEAVPDARYRLGIDSNRWHRAVEHGMSDRTADTWAVKCGLHPGTVFSGWFERGLTPLDDIAVHGSERGLPGWRPAYEYQEAS